MRTILVVSLMSRRSWSSAKQKKKDSASHMQPSKQIPCKVNELAREEAAALQLAPARFPKGPYLALLPSHYAAHFLSPQPHLSFPRAHTVPDPPAAAGLSTSSLSLPHSLNHQGFFSQIKLRWLESTEHILAMSLRWPLLMEVT